MDNPVFDVAGEELWHLGEAIALAFELQGPGARARDWALLWRGLGGEWYDNATAGEGTRPCLVFFWGKPSRWDRAAQRLPVESGAETVTTIARAFVVDRAKEATDGVEIDGDVRPGWRVFVEEWGHVAGDHCALFAVAPHACMYGK